MKDHVPIMYWKSREVYMGENSDLQNDEDNKQELKDVPDADDHLSDLLKEEEELVIAHRKQVEETLDIIREEMNLLVEADQPGNQLDDYISRLSAILSQKAAGKPLE